MALSEIERSVIENLIKRLSPDRPNTSPEVAAKLGDEAVQDYLQSWVVEPLKILANPNRTRGDLKAALSISR